MKVKDIIYPDEYILCEVDEGSEFQRLVTDIDKSSEEDILIIANSKKAPDLSAVDFKAVAVICNANTVLPYNIPSIRVSNPRLAMSRAFYRYENPRLDGIKIIGVTGTNGKTTTATLIKNVLAESGYKTGFIGTGKIEINGVEINEENYSMTTPDPPLLYNALRRMGDAECDAIVMEVSSHALALEKVAPLRFNIGVFTNLSPEHMDFHQTMEGYFSAKARLFEQCDTAVFNIDDKYAKKAYDMCKAKRICAGILWRGDVWASNPQNRGFDGVDYTYHSVDFSFKMRLPLPGIYNVYNSMLAAAVCIELGCKPCEVKRIMGSTSLLPGRYEIIKDRISVIIDYAHTSYAFESIMKDLSKIKKSGRLTVVFGCGGNRDRDKRPIMAKIAEKYADRIIITSDNSRTEDPKDIISDIIRGFERGCYEIKEDRSEAIRCAILEAVDGDLVAIIGKGPEKYNIDCRGYHTFDERKIVRSALRIRNGESE